jgi:hypothetical protein
MFDEMSKWELYFVSLGSALLYSVVVNEVVVLSFLGELLAAEYSDLHPVFGLFWIQWWNCGSFSFWAVNATMPTITSSPNPLLSYQIIDFAF